MTARVIIAVIVAVTLLTGMFYLMGGASAAGYSGSTYGASVGVIGQHRNHDAYHNGIDRTHRGHTFARYGINDSSQGCDKLMTSGWMRIESRPDAAPHMARLDDYYVVEVAGVVCEDNGVWSWSHHWMPELMYDEVGDVHKGRHEIE